MKVVVLLSGGLDSSTVLAEMVNRYGNNNVFALNMLYGQKHDKELKCALNIANYYKVDYKVIDIAEIFKYSNSSLLKHSTKEIQNKSYDLEKKEKDLIDTYVPFRNGVMLSIASSYALSIGASFVTYAAHKDDVCDNAYPDCGLRFYTYMNKAIEEGTDKKVKIIAPFIYSSKKDIVKKGIELGVPFNLTWSCYKGDDKACGVCGTCIDRLKAFKENGIKDYIEYKKEVLNEEE